MKKTLVIVVGSCPAWRLICSTHTPIRISDIAASVNIHPIKLLLVVSHSDQLQEELGGSSSNVSGKKTTLTNAKQCELATINDWFL